MLVRRIRAVAYAFHDEYWINMSADSKDFISKLLTKDVDKRLTVTQALQHSWVSTVTAAVDVILVLIECHYLIVIVGDLGRK
jgi:serine/threonine protein kinase